MNLSTDAPDVVTGLTLSYKGLETPVLEGLNHTFQRGRVHAVVGPSGSGKSTLVSAMLGLHHPEAGSSRRSCQTDLGSWARTLVSMDGSKTLDT